MTISPTIPAFDQRFLFAHFDKATGEIKQFSASPFAVAGLSVAKMVRVPDDVGSHTHKVDVDRLVDCGGDHRLVGRLVKRQDAVPWPEYIGIDGLKQTRNEALNKADTMMLPHRPLSDETRKQWADYMQALRDLGQHTTPKEFVAAWPLRPDGLDDLGDLRSKVMTPRGRLDHVG